MGATTSQGTGQGAATRSKPLIINGAVNAVNVQPQSLEMYHGNINAEANDGAITAVGAVTVSGAIYGASANINGAVTVSGAIYGASANINGAVTVSGNISATGVIRGNTTGQLLNTSLNVSSGTYTNATSGYTSIMSVNYTPVRSGTNIVVSFDAGFSMNGAGGDSFGAQITVSGNPIITRTQAFVSGGTGDTMRGNVLFPLSYLYQNGTAAATTIAVQGIKLTGDDTLTVNKSQAMLTITEYVR
jgi:hypothetical protein